MRHALTALRDPASARTVPAIAEGKRRSVTSPSGPGTTLLVELPVTSR